MWCPIGQDQDFKEHPMPDREPMQLLKYVNDMVKVLFVGIETGRSILDRRKFTDVTVRQTTTSSSAQLQQSSLDKMKELTRVSAPGG